MSKDIMKPEIRFKGFTGVWEECKLDDFGFATSGTSIESLFSKTGKYKIISIGSYSEKSTYNDQGIRVSNTDKIKNRVLKKGDLAMILNDKTASGRIIGRVLLIEKSNLYVYNQRTQRIEVNEKKYNSIFLYQLLNAPSIREKIFEQSQGNTQIYVNWLTIKELLYKIPNLKEQELIGIYFCKLDNLINFHQKKCEKLSNIKNAMLEKMFPQDNQKIPEIRFKEFTNDWKQRKLGDIFKFERPDDYIVDGEEYSMNGKIPVLTANKSFVLGYTDETHIYNKPSVIFDDFTLDNKYVDFSYMIKSSAIKILTVRDNVKDNLKFAYELLNLTKFEVMGHARHYITIVQPTNVLTPDILEQERISKMFFEIDNLINLHQKKCDKLNNIKNAMLDKMFV